MATLSRVQARGQVTLPRKVRQAAGIAPGDTVVFAVTAPGRVELQALPRMRLSDALERYRITVPVDEAADRPRWEEAAAREVLGSADE